MSRETKVLATVSGKGGVGKTIISANLARIISYNKKVLLVDLDFPNQGLTGLFAEYLQPSCYSARDMIFGSEAIELDRILMVRPNLFFVPAFEPSDRDRFNLDLNPLNKGELLANLDKKLNLILDNSGVDLIMLDCHGGLDIVSFASFALSDHTIVVSEPDKITFNGTLELLDYYEKNWADQNFKSPLDNDAKVSNESKLFPSSQGSFPTDKVIFLLNRVSGHFSYNGLIKLYKSEIEATSRFAAEIIGPYIFIPSDSLLAQSVSQYPIYIELAPESLFCQKLELIYTQLFGKRPEIIGRSVLYRWFERKRARSLQRELSSTEERRTAAVFSFITMAQFGMLLGFVWLGFGATRLTPGDVKAGSSLEAYPMLFGIGMALIGLGLLGTSWVNAVVSKYYRDALRLEYRLLRRSRRFVIAIVLLRLIRLFGARFYLLLSATFFGLVGVVYLTLAILSLLGFMRS
jgi:MinD-like ATPase involved in chromosome partitioning or flagellar assembly